MEKIFTATDVKKIKESLYFLASTEPYIELGRKIGLDMDEILVARENARKNLTHYQEFISEMK